MKGLWEGSWIRWRFEIRQLLQSLADVADDHHFRFFILCFFLDLLFRRDGALAQGSLQERFSFGGIWFSLFDIAAFFFWSSFKTTLDSFLLFLFLLFAFSCSFLSFSRAISFCLIDSRTNFGVGGDESNALDSEIHLIYLTVETLHSYIPSISTFPFQHTIHYLTRRTFTYQGRAVLKFQIILFFPQFLWAGRGVNGQPILWKRQIEIIGIFKFWLQI